jgi:hypothetical protein
MSFTANSIDLDNKPGTERLPGSPSLSSRKCIFLIDLQNAVFDQSDASTERLNDLFNEGHCIDIDYYTSQSYDSVHIGHLALSQK